MIFMFENLLLLNYSKFSQETVIKIIYLTHASKQFIG